ncbi:AMP-binding protein [Paenibacillus sp. 481]|uniref:AMP-binding protein n=1 Tax=Paenibacillus sp. 481 TaxID=2835869 RepID=UPI001E5B43EA|nr:AMP-binding protein [Paenibacillus sp. 481]UHA73198.1 AMP-binding protein [Paenibacillus sp. 481]
MATNNTTSIQHDTDSIVNMLELRAQRTPHGIAYGMLDAHFNLTEITYSELFVRVTTCSARLSTLNVAEGDRCLLMFHQGIDFIVSFLACHRIGAIPVPCNMVSRHKSLVKWENVAKSAQANCIITDRNSVSTVEQCIQHSEVLSSLPIYAEDGEPVANAVTGFNELALLQYTSGSTGDPKGVMVTHSSLMNNLKQLDAKFEFNERSVMVSWLPFYHDMGLIIGILQGLYSGYKVILMKPVDFMQQPLLWLRAISTYGATHTGAPNFAYELIADKLLHGTANELEGVTLKSLERAFCGAEPIHLNTLHKFNQAAKSYGLKEHVLCPGYGLAEASLVVSTYCVGQKVGWLKLNRSELQRGMVSILDRGVVDDTLHLPDEWATDETFLVGNGFVIDEHELCVRNPDDGTELGVQAIGEVCFSGPSVTKGYWNRAAETNSAFLCDDTNGQVYLRTGDLGFKDTNGELYMAGRIKDLIIIRGMNYYPQDIERTSFLADDDLRTDGAAAFSIHHDGEEKLVLIQEVNRTAVRNLQCDKWARQIRDAVLQVHGIPVETIVFIPPMHVPRTTSGKIQRSKAKLMYVNGEWSKVLGVFSAEQVRKDLAAVNGAANGAFNRAVNGAVNGIFTNQEELADYMIGLVANQLAVPATEIDRSISFTELGINSMMSLSMRNSLEQALGCTVPATALFNYNTVAQMSEYLLARTAGNGHIARQQLANEPATNRAVSSSEWDNCSEEELFELLKQELGGAINV